MNSASRRFLLGICGVLALLIVGTPATWAAPAKNWKPGVTGDWSVPGNWVEEAVPQDGDDVYITDPGSSVLLSGFSSNLNSVTLSKQLTFTNWNTQLAAVNVTVLSGGSMTCAGPFTDADASNRVNVLCTNFFLESGASIDVNAKGYAGGLASYQSGSGSGRGFYTANNRASAGSYGGRAGDDAYRGDGPLSAPYGVASEPLAPGSGGGRTADPGVGGPGGGAVRIDAPAGTVTVNGTITANGEATTGHNAGAGSGGGIYISCSTFAGTNGVLQANGGNGEPSENLGANGGGGGGRIAVTYSTADQTGMSFQAQGGTGVHTGDIGTLYFSDSSALGEIITNNICGQVSGFPSWAPNSLLVSNTWVRFTADGFQLTVANDLTIAGNGARLDIGGDSVLPFMNVVAEGRGWYSVYSTGATRPAVNVGGNLIVTNQAIFAVYSVSTNDTVPNYGALVSVTGDVVCASSSWIYPLSQPDNGGSPYFQMANVTILNNGGIKADYGGFKGGTGYGKGVGAGGRGSGGGYGGIGGKSQGGDAGGTNYGSAVAPMDCGSGGGPYSSQAIRYPGARGGGLVRMHSRGDVTISGTISANGEQSAAAADGGGSGGGIYITCRTLAGSGSLQAIGGNGDPGYGGAGGGGRIAVWRGKDVTVGMITNVNGGAGYSNGWVGTIYSTNIAPVATNLWGTNMTANTADMVGSLNSTGTAPTEVYCFWGTSDGGAAWGAWANTNYLDTNGVGVLTNHVETLEEGTLYKFRFYATNAWGDGWSPTYALFSTPGAVNVINDAPTDMTQTSATMRGIVLSGDPTPNAYVCWQEGAAAAADTSLWQHVESIGALIGPFSTNVTGLLANQTYYYRCYVTNDSGDKWAPEATNFPTATPTITIADAPTVVEGNSGTTNLNFVVTLSATSAVDVTVVFSAADGLATGGSDYVPTNGVLVFPASNQTSRVITVVVNGDTTDEYPYEDLYLNLSAPTNATLTRNQAYGRILDEDDSNQTKTWTGSGNWNSVTNWSPVGWPGPLDDVIIGSGSCLLTGSVSQASLIVSNNGTLTFSNWTTAVTAGNVTIQTGGVVACAGPFVNGAMSNRVWLVCTNLFIATGGSIGVDARGYAGGTAAATSGNGLGRGTPGGRGGAAGYGGRGGDDQYRYDMTFGSPYGIAGAPVDPGSGGAGGYEASSGHGGGAVRVDAAGIVMVNGTISANGGDSGSTDGPGSGGGIYVTCSAFAGTGGVIRAKGGTTSDLSASGGGGGGRIAVIYSPAAQSSQPTPTVMFLAPGGNGNHPGDIGTLYFPDSRFLPETLTSDLLQGQLLGFSSWSPSSLTVSNTWVRFAADGFQLSVSNDFTVVGSAGRVDLGADAFIAGFVTPAAETRGWLAYYSSFANRQSLNVGGRLILTNQGSLYVYSACTNASVRNYGASVDVGGNTVIASDSWLCLVSNPTNGGAPILRLANLDVAANAGVSATYSGFFAMNGPGAGTSSGRAGGGGYGGEGGKGQDGTLGGTTYGSSNAPVDSGSGGGMYNGNPVYPGGRGGGVVRITSAGNVTVNGSIMANGEYILNADGAGSGGSIYLACHRLQGAGSIQANGGAGDVSYCGGGGGGRIALYRYPGSPFSGSVTANGGAGYSNGAPGTICYGAVPYPGTIISLY